MSRRVREGEVEREREAKKGKETRERGVCGFLLGFCRKGEGKLLVQSIGRGWAGLRSSIKRTKEGEVRDQLSPFNDEVETRRTYRENEGRGCLKAPESSSSDSSEC
jgi:hypothetical protein